MSKDLNHYAATILQDYMPVPFLKAFFSKKTPFFRLKRFTKLWAPFCWLGRTIRVAPFFVFPKFKKGTIRRRISMHEAIKHCGLFSELY